MEHFSSLFQVKKDLFVGVTLGVVCQTNVPSGRVRTRTGSTRVRKLKPAKKSWVFDPQARVVKSSMSLEEISGWNDLKKREKNFQIRAGIFPSYRVFQKYYSKLFHHFGVKIFIKSYRWSDQILPIVIFWPFNDAILLNSTFGTRCKILPFCCKSYN